MADRNTMTNAEENIKVINKNNSGFPDYLDFEKLRKEGIEYLGKLSGKIWTDHNVHDPGITILEVLCYALLDLGYRTNLPSKDIFTPKPEESGTEDNFFTAAEILASNPLTIIDYRKLLIDLKGVKNAWLKVATGEEDFCNQTSERKQMLAENANSEPVEYLNGLYHVYIETEKNPDTDFKDEASAKAYFKDLTNRVKNSLMAHRNFCEDFLDVYVLCKLKLGVCAGIELKDGTDPEKAYLSIAQKLRDFLSPSPHFYTLQQLLDKGKSVDEIFAGRPYNVTDSHGFVDTEELLQLKLKKEIHLSDLHTVILGVEGVTKVTSLQLRNCDGTSLKTDSNWKIKLPENNVPDFSIDCSGFKFTRNGLPIELDTKKYEGLLNINFIHNGKVLYRSPYLDLEIPKGTYHPDLDEHFLLQEDFPRVYGIAEGGLPDDASNLRKAQALQLKGYLLFFDQLLAGYLAQLSNIRSLFAMSSSGNKDKQHTYFLNKLESLPELNQLLRFAVTGNESNGLGKEGSILLRAVPKEELEELIALNQISKVDPLILSSFTFSRLNEQQIAISELKEDLYNGSFDTGYLNKDSSCIYYYLISSSETFALVSNVSFKTIAEANLHQSSVSYIGTFDENYRTFIIDADHVSFSLELNTVSFGDYLQRIIEDKELYAERRNGFLDHLLSRFSERFTDFALLSYGSGTGLETSTATIKAKENFLANYDEISANRGRAYDYLKNKWNNDNSSGFENEAKFLSGIENKQVHNLCNFVVEQYDEQYVVDLKIAGQTFFVLQEKFDSMAEGEEAARSVFAALADPDKLKTQYIAHEKLYTVQVQYNDRSAVSFLKKYERSQEADALRANFKRMFSDVPDPDEVFVNSFKYDLQLIDDQGDLVRNSALSYHSEAEAQAALQQLTGKINDAKNWQAEMKAKRRIGTLYFNKTSPELLKFVDVKSFKIDINNTIVGRPDMFTYDLLDNANSFKFYPEKEFGTSRDARQHCHFVISLAGNETNYVIRTVEGHFRISIGYQDQLEATCYSAFATEAEAKNMMQQIAGLVRANEFRLKSVAIADGWKFNYRLGLEPASDYLFTSAKEYASPDEALKAATAFHQAIPSLQLQQHKEGAVLSPLKANTKVPPLNLSTAVKLSDIKTLEAVIEALEQQKDIAQLKGKRNVSAFRTAVKVDESNGTGRYVYRLVDKDQVLAFYLQKYQDRDQAGLSRRKAARAAQRNLKYLQLCLGGDIVSEITDPGSGKISCRYQLKAHNYLYTSGNLVGTGLILFESNAIYATKELAITAFEENYADILQLAANGENYETLVYIPEDTKTEISSYGEGTVEEVIATLAKSYPVKRVEYGSKAFNELFCENVELSSDDLCKSGKLRKQVYYFGTYQNGKDPQQWQSLKYYDTPEAAMKDFLFFITLLKYAGNLYVDCNHCNGGKEAFYRIYIREVLAESSLRFSERATAWGKEGLEKFICAVQSGVGFHHYQRKEDCCYSFYLNCGKDMLVHPCVYDTAKKRNEVLNELYAQFRKYTQQNSYGLKVENQELILLDENGAPFARQSLAKQEEMKRCEVLMELIAQLSGTALIYSEENGILFIKDYSGRIILQSYGKEEGLEQWKETLRAFVCYFPLVKSQNEKTGKDRYEIALKLPGFGDCREKEEEPCGCSAAEEENEPVCFVAWKSSCYYSNCEDAMQVLLYVRHLLSDFENYQPLVDCACNTFGIAVNYDPIKTRREFSTERIAFNPQCYESAQAVCAAVERTKRLSNAEGLHVAEHILLRPHCTEDCSCREGRNAGADKRDCKYKWIVPKDDPCSEEKDIPFIPGSDPYSFIATVVLPAWPQRFRSLSGRMLMEDILYRLAPAHVMLRILWLAPADFCAFESKYKDWRRWLAKTRTCNPEFSVCDFLDFLFRKNYECLEECKVCLPCQEEEPKTNPCSNEEEEEPSKEKGKKTSDQKEKKNQKDKNCFLNQVNDSFGWEEMDCKERSMDNQRLKAEKLSVETESVKVKPVGHETKPVINETKPVANAKEKTAFINHRLESYRNNTAGIAGKLNKNTIVLNVQSFLKEKAPAIEHFETIVMSIIQNKKPSGKNAVALNKHQVLHLMESVVGYTLDHLCLKKNKSADITLLNSAFEKMRKAKIDMSAIYNHWDGLEVKKYQPKLRIDEIKTLLTGISKK